ncbi:hypothetical protein Tco_1425822 [Tanacetum coccineum]
MIVQALEDMGEDSAAPTNSYSTPIITQPSSSKPQKKKSKRKQRKDNSPTEPILDEANNEEPISTPSYDPPQSEKRKKLGTLGLKRLWKVGSASRVESFNDNSLGAQEDASKQGKKIADLDADEEVTLIDETQERSDEETLFDVQDDLQGEEVFTEQEVVEKEVSAADPVTTASATTTVDELTLAQTLIEIKAAKPKAVTTSVTTITTAVASTRPKAKGIVFHYQEEQASAFTPIKDQIALDEELALRLHAKEQTELEKERVAQEEASKAANFEELDSIQAMIEADEQLAVNSIVPMDSEVVKSSETRTEGSSKIVGDELESDKSKKQKIDEHVEAEKDDDQEEAEMKRHIKIVKDDEVAIDAIPLATKPPMIVEYKIDKDGRIGYIKLIRADRSSKRYLSMIKML